MNITLEQINEKSERNLSILIDANRQLFNILASLGLDFGLSDSDGKEEEPANGLIPQMYRVQTATYQQLSHLLEYVTDFQNLVHSPKDKGKISPVIQSEDPRPLKYDGDESDMVYEGEGRTKAGWNGKSK